MVKPEQKRLYDELLGTKCRCGRVKIARQSFCGRCYKSLPAAMQRAMYRLIGNGYEEAYAKAVEFLTAKEAA